MRNASGNRLYGSLDNKLYRARGSSGIAPNPMAMTHNPALRELRDYISETSDHADVRPGFQWFGSQGGAPGWADPRCKTLACLIPEDGQRSVCLMFNAGGSAVDFSLPPVPAATHWHLAVDTAREAPRDRPGENDEPPLEGTRSYCLHPDPAPYSWLEGRWPNERSSPGHDSVCGCRRCATQQRMGSYCPQKVAKHFNLQWSEMEARHRLTFESHEMTKGGR